MNNAITDLDKLYLQLIKRLTKSSTKKLIGMMAKQAIYNRVKSGFGVNKEGLPPDATKKAKLKKLAESYTMFRQGKLAFYTGKQGQVYAIKKSAKNRKYVQKPNLGRFGSPKRSNLTLSGRLLEAITVNVSNSVNVTIKNSSRVGDDMTNKQLGEMVAEDRPFFSLTKTEYRIIEQKLISIVNKEIKRIFK